MPLWMFVCICSLRVATAQFPDQAYLPTLVAKKEKKPENIHGKKSEDSENAQNNRNGKDSEWRDQLSLSQERHFEKEMNHLEDKKRHEEQYAMKDGPEQLQEMHAEYARKESDVLKTYQRKAEHNLRGDPKKGSSEQPKPVELSDENPGAMNEFVAQKALQEQLYVLAAAKKEKKPENIHGKKSEDSENSQNNRNGKDSEWRNHLSLSQERHLEKEMNHLEDKKRHEEQYALKDGPEQLQEMHAEYVRKESDVLKSYQRKAEHNLRGDPKEGSSEQPKPVEELSRMDRPEDLGNEKLQGQGGRWNRWLGSIFVLAALTIMICKQQKLRRSPPIQEPLLRAEP